MDGNKNQKVNIIIVNYNSWKDTVACISSIINSTYNNYQIFVVDNASPNDDVEHLYNWLKSNELNSLIIDVKETSVDKKVNLIDNSKIIIFKNDENLGYGAGNNLAIQYLINIRNHEYLWLLNPRVHRNDSGVLIWDFNTNGTTSWNWRNNTYTQSRKRKRDIIF